MIDIIKEAIKNSLLDININLKEEIIIEKPKSKDNGDYSTNICLKIAKNEGYSPIELAEKIKTKIKFPELENIDIKMPGFINFFVKKEHLIENINKVIELGKNYGRNNIGQNEKINYEYVSANPTGILHTGNARGGAYGDNMARILSFCGYDVTREYYINDAGNQVNNLGLSLKARYLEKCGLEFEIPQDGYHGLEIVALAEELYSVYKDELIDKNNEYFSNYAIDKLMTVIVDDLKLYGVEYDVMTSEKSIYQKYDLEELVKTLTEKGYTYEKDNAIWLKSSELLDDKDHVLVKSDGVYAYLLPDIAYHIDKINRGYKKMVTILGTDHHGYVNRIKSGLMAMGYDPKMLDIKLLQLVRLIQDGQEVKMSKRTGKSIALRELVEEIGLNAARYYFASRSLDTQIDLDMDLAIKKSNENPVYYVSYAYARICTILENYGEMPVIKEYKNLDLEKTEDVLERIYHFPNVVIDAAKKELPHLLTNYIYNLATSFHSMYNEYRFISDDKNITKENLSLLLAIKITMYNTLNLLGIEPPEKM